MALRRVFSLSHVPPGGDLAAKDFLVTYFDPTLTSEVDSATSEIDRKSYVRNIGGLIRCNDLIFTKRSQRVDRCCTLRPFPLLQRKENRNTFDEITSVEEEYFLSGQIPLKFSAREETLVRRFSIGSMVRPSVRRDASYSRNSKVYSSLERLVVLTWFLLNEANN